jgi:hypothetical protein
MGEEGCKHSLQQEVSIETKDQCLHGVVNRYMLPEEFYPFHPLTLLKDSFLARIYFFSVGLGFELTALCFTKQAFYHLSIF